MEALLGVGLACKMDKAMSLSIGVVNENDIRAPIVKKQHKEEWMSH